MKAERLSEELVISSVTVTGPSLHKDPDRYRSRNAKPLLLLRHQHSCLVSG